MLRTEFYTVFYQVLGTILSTLHILNIDNLIIHIYCDRCYFIAEILVITVLNYRVSYG